MEEFIGEFKAESTAIMETLQGLLLSYEDSSSKEHVAEELFRGVHTLKGTSKMFGFDNIENVTHQLENILDEHRTNNLPFTANLIELVLSTLDFCLHALEGRSTAESYALMLEQINGYKVTEISNEKKSELVIYCILVTPDVDIFERGVNLLSAFKELSDLGVVDYFQPKKATALEKQIADKKLDFHQIDIWLSTDKPLADVEDVFMFFKGSEYEIQTVNNPDMLSELFQKAGLSRGKALSKIERSLRHDFFDQYFRLTAPPVVVPEVQVKETISEPVKEDIASVEPLKQGGSSRLNYINVPLSKLDQMMNLVSEFVTLSGEVKHFASMLSSDGLQSIAERLEKVSTSFRDNAFNMRLVPIQILSTKLQRYVKELSQKLGKRVRFITEGMDTEIDKSIINQIEGPLMHIVRNAIDHGLELPAERKNKGKSEECILKLSAFYSGTNVFIHIQDDGAGINVDRVRAKAISNGLISAQDILTQQEAIALIFKPGFSTTETATEVSGRGVGMDVVRKNIHDLRGSIEVTTEKDLGTSFAIRLPLALSIMDVMIVKVGGLNYMVPNSEIEFCTSEKFSDQVQRKGYNLVYDNKLIPFMELRSVFNVSGEAPDDSSILILDKNDQLVSINVDEILGKEQVVIKPIDETLQIIPYLAGTSILGNGELAFLIDVLKLKELYAIAH